MHTKNAMHALSRFHQDLEYSNKLLLQNKDFQVFMSRKTHHNDIETIFIQTKEITK